MRCRMRCGDIWRCGGPKKKEKQLMEYDEIVALTCDNAVTELNSAAAEYYDKFSREGHLLVDCLSDNGTDIKLRNEPSDPYIGYDGTWEEKYPAV